MRNLKLRKFILKVFWSIIRKFAPTKISCYTVPVSHGQNIIFTLQPHTHTHMHVCPPTHAYSPYPHAPPPPTHPSHTPTHSPLTCMLSCDCGGERVHTLTPPHPPTHSPLPPIPTHPHTHPSPICYPVIVEVRESTRHLSSIEDHPLLLQARVTNIVDVEPKISTVHQRQNHAECVLRLVCIRQAHLCRIKNLTDYYSVCTQGS